MTARTFRLLALLLVLSGSFVAQQPLYTLKVDVPWVVVDVTVTDPAGRTVSDLTSEDFEVLENGVPQELQSFTPTSAPYNILLLFDRSGSTEHKWSFMQQATAGFIAHLRPQDRIAIDSFDFEFQPLARWSYRRDLSLDSLKELTQSGKSVGGTALYGALETAVKTEFKNTPGRRAMVVLTDGRDTAVYKDFVARNRRTSAADDRKFQRTLKTLRQSRIPLYIVALNTEVNLEPNLTGGDEYRNLRTIFPNTSIADDFLREVRTRLELLARESGGRVLYPASMEDVAPLYEQISREIGSAYSLAYIPADSKADGKLRRIEVRVADATLKLSQSRSAYFAK